MQLVFIIIIIGVVHWKLRYCFERGLSLSIGLMVCLPHVLRINLPGELPNFTIQRLIILLLLLHFIRRRCSHDLEDNIPLSKMLKTLIILYSVSLAFGTHTEFAVKTYLSFVCESALFYWIIAHCVQSKSASIRNLQGALIGLMVVAIFAWIEKYYGFNPVDSLLPDYERTLGAKRDVLSTYPHRILLGTAMAMAFPLAMSYGLLGLRAASGNRSLLGLLIVILSTGATYFANSRGPWVAMAISGFILFSMGDRDLKRALVVVGVLVLICLIVFPGVYHSISGRVKTTFDLESFKGGTYQYRWELWKLSFSLISHSPWVFLFGYGPGCAPSLGTEWEMPWGTQIVRSWDNHYALYLLEIGILGLIAKVWLYGLVLLGLYKKWTAADSDAKLMIASVMASLTAFFFMQSNVMNFAPQLTCLVWALIGSGSRLVEENSNLNNNNELKSDEFFTCKSNFTERLDPDRTVSHEASANLASWNRI